MMNLSKEFVKNELLTNPFVNRNAPRRGVLRWSEIVDRGLPLRMVRMMPGFPFLHQGRYF